MKKHSFSRFLAAVLAILMAVSLLPAAAFADDEPLTATLVTDASTLKAGDKIALVAEANGSVFVAGGFESKYLTSIATTADKLAADAEIITLGGEAGAWTLTNTDGQLYTNAAKALNISGSGTGTWTISIDESGLATIASTNADYGRFLYNVNSPRFLNYASDANKSMLLPYIYKIGSQQEEDEPVNHVIESLDELTEGAQVVIYNPANMMALSQTYTGNYNSGVALTENEGKLKGFKETEVWTVGIGESEGIYTFSTADGHKLSMDAGYTSTPLDKVNDTWLVTEAEGGYYINNIGRDEANSYRLEWYAGKGNWSCFNKDNDGDLFIQQFYLVVEPIEEDDPPIDPPVADTAALMSEAPADGDQIVIYSVGGNAVMGNALNGNKMAASALAEAAGDKIDLASDMGIITVKETADGQLAFVLDGKYITSAETGNGMLLSDELTDCGKWELEQAEDGIWYIHNVGANFNSNYNQYLEYYNGFTTFGKKETDAYKFKFYLVKGAVKPGIVTDLTTLQNGDKVVIYNPANMKALSSIYTGNYNTGIDVTIADGALSGFAASEVWVIGINADGSYTLSTYSDGKKLSMGSGYSSTPLDDVNTSWEITKAVTENCFYIKNTARGNYLEWYADKNDWSSYSKINNEALFAQTIYLIDEVPERDTGDLPKTGDKVVIYNATAEGVLGMPNEMNIALENAATTVENGTAIPGNGARVFTVTVSGDYYSFESGGLYLASNDDEALFLTETLDDYAMWKPELKTGGNGYVISNKAAKYKTSPVCIEYFTGSFSGWTYKATDKDIFEFNFYPVAEDTVVIDGIVDKPAIVFSVNDAYLGADYTFSFTVNAVFGIAGDLAVTVGSTPVDYVINEDGSFSVTLPAEIVEGESLVITVSGTDNKGISFSDSVTVAVKDEPVIESVLPAAGSQTGDDKRPVIGFDYLNAGTSPVISLNVNGEDVEFADDNGSVRYTPSTDMEDGSVTVTASVTRADGKSVDKTWKFTVGVAAYQRYYGQLHSHTAEYSDGAGTLQAGLDYIKNLPDSANVQFVAFTDHSNYFDASGAANPEGAMYDMSLATQASQDKWTAYKSTVAKFNEDNSGKQVAIAGFEMTWSGGPGHINTFNTPGIVSRNNTTLNNKTADAGMKAYYALLSQAEGADSLSQFNHPGTTFGTFSDFSYWDAVLDTRIYTVEVGNGEGAIGQGGYYPSYEYYTMALDKGWHLAPTNNQDNHKGKWGNANDARDVIITDDFTEQGIYDAIRAYRMYATEDKNLELDYTANGMVMGSMISEVPDALDISVYVSDPDKTDSISKVEVVVNSGRVAYTWNDPVELATGALECSLPADYSYYFIRVTEGDGDIAVTAPVWVGEVLKLGISSFECGTSTPVTDEEVTLTTTLFNSEATDAKIKSLTFKWGDEIIGTAELADNAAVPASGSLAVDFKFTPTVAKVMTITVIAELEQDGVAYEYTMSLDLDVLDADSLVYIGIDASHYNEYVAGNYKDSMGNFGALAAQYSVRTVELKSSEDIIAACANDKFVAMIFTAPSRRLADAQSDPRTYSADEIEAIKSFNANGGVVVFAGWSDYYENYDVITSNPAIKHMAETQNEVLAAIGSSLRIGDNATNDDLLNGGQTQRLYFNTYNMDNFLNEGVEYDADHPNDRLYTEVFSQYGGASIYAVDASGNALSALPESVSPAVFGHASTYVKDSDGDGIDDAKYDYAEGDSRLLVLATEELDGQGMIIVSGAAFMSNFEVQATISDSGSEKNYSNYKICENLLGYLNPISIADIKTVREQEETGFKYTIEGVVTANASGYDKDTAFFDCTYVQDDTAGICVFPVAGNFKIGDKVRITGTTDFYQGEPELQVTSITLIDEGNEVSPVEITAKQLNERSVEGNLVTVKGTVESFAYENGLIQTIMVKDAAGDVARVFIDGYITTAKDVENIFVGCSIEATGLASFDDTFNAPDGPFPRIRVRNRADIVCSGEPGLPFTDVSESDWFYDAVYEAYYNGFMSGISDTLFNPNGDMTRAMMVTILYNMAGEPAYDLGSVTPFSDVSESDWFYEPVMWAAANGIVSGMGDGTFAPNANITRQQAAVILVNYDEIVNGRDTKSEAELTYTDADQIASWALDAVKYCTDVEYFHGNEAGAFDPSGTLTRAQCATLAVNVMEANS